MESRIVAESDSCEEFRITYGSQSPRATRNCSNTSDRERFSEAEHSSQIEEKKVRITSTYCCCTDKNFAVFIFFVLGGVGGELARTLPQTARNI